MSGDQQWAMRVAMDRIRRELLAGRHDALASVEIERRLELEARRGFGQAVAEARAEGRSWEQIVERVPGLDPAVGSEAAESLFELVAVPGSPFGEHHLSWRCGDCNGLVLDRGPDAGHPVDAERGHRDACGRLAAEVRLHCARLDAENQLATRVVDAVAHHLRSPGSVDRPIEPDGPGLELW